MTEGIQLNKDEALASEVTDAIWSLWKAKTIVDHGDTATMDEMLTVARFTAATVAAFMDRKPLTEALYGLLERRIVDAVILVCKEKGINPTQKVQ